MAAGVGLKEVGAQRTSESRIVDLHRDIGTGFLADALPARTDFNLIGFLAHHYAEVGRILGIGRLGGNERQCSVECDGATAPGQAVFGCGKLADLGHWSALLLGWESSSTWGCATQKSSPTPASSVHTR